MENVDSLHLECREFLHLDKRWREDRVIWITRHNKKAFAVVYILILLQTVLETIEILSDPDALKMLQDSLRDIRAGRLYDHEDVKSELLNKVKVNVRWTKTAKESCPSSFESPKGLLDKADELTTRDRSEGVV